MRSFNLEVDSLEIVLKKHISVKAAAECSGYGAQYLRRLLRSGRLEGMKIGRIWLISLVSLEAQLSRGQMMRIDATARNRLSLMLVKEKRIEAKKPDGERLRLIAPRREPT